MEGRDCPGEGAGDRSGADVGMRSTPEEGELGRFATEESSGVTGGDEGLGGRGGDGGVGKGRRMSCRSLPRNIFPKARATNTTIKIASKINTHITLFFLLCDKTSDAPPKP